MDVFEMEAQSYDSATVLEVECTLPASGRSYTWAVFGSTARVERGL